jgi:hypothetical protein
MLLTIIAAEIVTPNTILMRSFRQGYGLLHNMIIDASKSASASSETKQIMHVKLLVVDKLAQTLLTWFPVFLECRLMC